MSNSSEATGWGKRLYRAIKPDWVFAILLVFLVSVPLRGGIVDAEPELARYATLFAVMVGVTGLALFLARLEKRLAEDYYYRLVAQSAVVAVAGTVLVVFAYEKFAPATQQLGSHETLFVLLGCWAIGYFLSRFFGPDA